MDVKPSVTKKRRSQLRTKLEKHEMLTLSSSSEGEQDNDNDDDGLAPLSPRVADRKPVLVNKGKGRAIEPDELPPAKKHKTKDEELREFDEAVNAFAAAVKSGAIPKLDSITAKMDLQRRSRSLGVNWSNTYAHLFATPPATSPAPSLNNRQPGGESNDDLKPRVNNNTSTEEIIRRAEELAKARAASRTPSFARVRRMDREQREQSDALEVAYERRRKRLEAEKKARQQRTAKMFDSDDDNDEQGAANTGPPKVNTGQYTYNPNNAGSSSDMPGYIPPPAALAGTSSGLQEPLPQPTQNPFALPDLPRRRAGDGRDQEDEDEELRVTEADIANFDRIAMMPEFEKSRKVNEAVAELGLTSQQDRIPGTRITPVPFQFISINWMIKQEMGRWGGGVLGDEMGLGKTIQALSVCMMNRTKDPATKTTLVVCPLALLHQWESEIRTKTVDQAVHIYHGSNKNKVKRVRDLQKFDFVITTSSTLALEWEDPYKSMKESGILYDMLWYRVILDEAHTIRNRSTRLSKAVCKLDAVFRWALTGSPFVNNTADYFALFRFLRVKPWCSWAFYNDKIVRKEKHDPRGAADAAQRAITPIIIRRRKTDMLEGKPLVKLEPKTVEFVEQEFDEEEKEIYLAAEQRAQIQIGRYIRRGSLLKNMAHIFSLLLRLRQICVHPSLITVGGETDTEYLAKELERARKLLGPQRCAQLRADILEACVEAERERREYDEAQDDDADDADLIGGQECPICFDAIAPKEGVITRCGHSFCRTCIMNILNSGEEAGQGNDALEQGLRYKEGQQPCPKPVDAQGFFEYDAFRPTAQEIEEAIERLEGGAAREQRVTVVRSAIVIDDDDDEELPDLAQIVDMTAPKFVKHEGPKVAVKKRQLAINQKPFASTSKIPAEEKPKAEEKQTFKPTGGSRRHAGLDGDDEKDLEDIIPSTKMIHILKTLRAWKEEDPKIKTIIISQFTSALDLLDAYLTAHRIRCVRFQGDCTADERVEATNRLRSDPKVRVMLLSLKAGGVGLNLVSACRVISLDMAWSPAVEAQAFDRVHRLGQERRVLVQRLLIKDSVEERIRTLQERKQTLSDLTLSEGVGAADKRDKCSIPELLGLFRLDVNGRQLEKANRGAERAQAHQGMLDGLPREYPYHERDRDHSSKDENDDDDDDD